MPLLINSTSARLFTLVWSKHDAQTVLLLHGGPGVPIDFTAIAQLLASRYQVITFEQRGTARSPASRASYSMEEYIGDIDAVAGHFGADKFHLFGHSWGGLYAQIYAERHPERLSSLFLCSPGSGTGVLWAQTQREVMAFNRSRCSLWRWSVMGAGALFGALGGSKGYQLLFRRALENYVRDFDPSFTASAAMVENVRAEPINKTLASILYARPLKTPVDYNIPVCITYGERDIYGASRDHVRARFPDARVVEIPHAGHISWLNNPAGFNQILRDFYQLP